MAGEETSSTTYPGASAKAQVNGGVSMLIKKKDSESATAIRGEFVEENLMANGDDNNNVVYNLRHH